MRKRPAKSRHSRSSKTHDPTPAQLRVVGGQLRGRVFAYHGDPGTRPMKQRVREATFNLVGPRVKGTHAVDLFAGTGALAWEALSRGATSATLIERHFPTARLIGQNAATLDLADRIEVITGDTFIWARNWIADTSQRYHARPWLIFCSPPYELYVSQLESMIDLVQRLVTVAPAGSLMVVEADERFDTSQLPNPASWDVRTYAPAVLAMSVAARQ